MTTETQQYEGIVLGRKQNSYLVRLVDLIHDTNPEMKSLISREAFPQEHRDLQPGSIFFWTIQSGTSHMLVV